MIRTMVLNGWAASSEAWSLCTFARDALFSYLDQLDGLPERTLTETAADDRWILVGWSMGGSTALRLASAFPGMIAGLVLIAATPRMMADPATDWRGMTPRRLEALRYGFRLTHGEGLFGLPPGRPNPYASDTDENLARGLDYLLKTDVRADLERTFVDKVRRSEDAGEARRSEDAGEARRSEDAGEVRMSERGMRFPVFVFQSEHDGIVRPENALYLKTVFPEARVRLVAGNEHALPIVIPEEIDAAVCSVKRDF